MRIMLASIGAIGLAMAASPALANDDRAPTAEERTAIEQSLRTQGYVRWDADIELDDGHWEVDNARRENGQKFDLKLDPQSLRVVRSERDDD